MEIHPLSILTLSGKVKVKKVKMLVLSRAATEGTFSNGETLVLLTPKDSLALGGFSLASFCGYETGREGKCPQWDTYGEKCLAGSSSTLKQIFSE